MSLHSWQAGLLEILSKQDDIEATIAKRLRDLSPDEVMQLRKAGESIGLDVTADVVRWWRLARLNTALPFSIQLVKRLDLQRLIDDYLKRPCVTLFFVREAESFYKYLLQFSVPLILKDMVAFEHGLHRARFSMSQSISRFAAEGTTTGGNSVETTRIEKGRVEQSDLESCVVEGAAMNGLPEVEQWPALYLNHDPEACMAAILGNTELPDALDKKIDVDLRRYFGVANKLGAKNALREKNALRAKNTVRAAHTAIAQGMAH